MIKVIIVISNNNDWENFTTVLFTLLYKKLSRKFIQSNLKIRFLMKN